MFAVRFWNNIFVSIWIIFMVSLVSINGSNCDYSNCRECQSSCSPDYRECVQSSCSSSNRQESEKNGDCPRGFTYIPEANKCYRLEIDRLEWEVARLRCKSLHPKSHSVVVNDEAEQRAIAQYINDRKDYVQTHCYAEKTSWGPFTFIWTAGQRTNPLKPSSFVWKPDNSKWNEMTYTNWQTGEPNFGWNEEACAHLAHFPSMTWNDAACEASPELQNILKAGNFTISMCVLCEIDME